MAVVLDVFASVFSRTAFIKPPDLQREWTAMPRALVNFTVDGVLSAKPLNDSQEVNVSIVLPREFAYRWLSANVFIVQDVAIAWTNGTYLEVLDGVRGLPVSTVQRWPLLAGQAFERIPTATPMLIWRWDEVVPTDVLQARNGISPTIVFKATNQAVSAGAAGEFNATFSLLEFDIEQAQRFPMHWPQMVYNRT